MVLGYGSTHYRDFHALSLGGGSTEVLWGPGLVSSELAFVCPSGSECYKYISVGAISTRGGLTEMTLASILC